jgi:hypothetical protein
LEQNIGHQMVLRLVTLFNEAANTRLARMPEICAAGNFAALRRIAHDWVSDAASVGAKKLSRRQGGSRRKRLRATRRSSKRHAS